MLSCFSNPDGAKPQVASKNGKKADSGTSSGSFFTWFIVLALLGVWTSVAVVYFDLVDYQGVLGEYSVISVYEYTHAEYVYTCI